MKNILHDVSLKDYNYLSVDANAKYFVRLGDEEALPELVKFAQAKSLEILVLGKGSNILFVDDYPGLVILNCIPGREVIETSDTYAVVELGAGEDWPDFVRWAVFEQDMYGLENLTDIPGTVGAAPAQNIAAYGQNQSDIFVSLRAYDTQKNEFLEFDSDMCDFSYRSSLFKKSSGRYIITRVRYKLGRGLNDKLETSYDERPGRYDSIVSMLQKLGEPPYDSKDVSKAISEIRKKLPEKENYGTVGSFFINPTVSIKKYKELAAKIDGLQFYPVKDLDYSVKNIEDIQGEYVKIPAAHLIDIRGWKGKWYDHVSMFERHALCLVSDKEATGRQILQHAKRVKQDIMQEFGVELESEVKVIGGEV